MRRSDGTAEPTTVALVGFEEVDRSFLMKVLDCLECPLAADCKCTVRFAEGSELNLASLQQGRIQVVFWDGDRMPETWKPLLERFARLSAPPLLIVTSRLADDHLWAEALNLGAYDVLAKPFEVGEVARIAGLACERWRRCEHEACPFPQAAARDNARFCNES